jgi:hypothetical protein
MKDSEKHPLKGRLPTELRPAEEKWLHEASQELTPQQLTRALFFIASEEPSLAERARQAAREGKRLGSVGDPTPGKIDVDEVREAVEEEGSLRRAAAAVGAHRSSIRYVCAEHDIHVPSMGRVPEQLERYK